MENTIERDKQVYNLIQEGNKYRVVADMFNISIPKVQRIVKKLSGENLVEDEEPRSLGEELNIVPKIIPNEEVNEENAAKNLNDLYNRIALSMEKKLSCKANLDKKYKYLQILFPIVSKQIKVTKQSLNILVSEGTGKQLLDRLANYAEKKNLE